MSEWDMAGRILQAASDIVVLITEIMNARGVKSPRVAEILPALATTLERAAADLRAAKRFGTRAK